MNREAAIEAGARARHERRRAKPGPERTLPWEDLLPSVRQRAREEVAAVIDAALPHLVGDVLALADEADEKGSTLQTVPELRLAGTAYRGMAERIRKAVAP